jgi:hypothetical protein
MWEKYVAGSRSVVGYRRFRTTCVPTSRVKHSKIDFFLLRWLYYCLKVLWNWSVNNIRTDRQSTIGFAHGSPPGPVKEVPRTDPRHISLDLSSSLPFPLQPSVYKYAKSDDHVSSSACNKLFGFWKHRKGFGGGGARRNTSMSRLTRFPFNETPRFSLFFLLER